MASFAKREQKLGNLVKYEQGTEHGFCREVMTVTLTPTSSIGDVLVDAAGKLVLVDVAGTANAEAVLVDTNVYDLRPASGTVDADLAVMVRGDAILADKALKYNADINTDAEIAALHAVLAAKGMLVREQV